MKWSRVVTWFEFRNYIQNVSINYLIAGKYWIILSSRNLSYVWSDSSLEYFEIDYWIYFPLLDIITIFPDLDFDNAPLQNSSNTKTRQMSLPYDVISLLAWRLSAQSSVRYLSASSSWSCKLTIWLYHHISF